MRLWEDFHPRVMPYAIGCPNPMVNQALTDAAREFCLTSKAWQQTEEFTATAGVDPLDFVHETGSEVVQVLHARVDGLPIRVLDDLQLPAPEAESGTCPQTLYRIGEEQYRILPALNAGQTVSITLALRPTENGTGVGDLVFSRHTEGIAAGARSILQRMPRQPWSDLGQAQIDRAIFDREMSWAANRTFMQREPSQHRVKKWG